ncbi:MAG: hypothetical protein J3K34DRAFT_442322 [Monoraphidium minutum]|nr:MAG: hypothetical protein J3K34DRAFT_442322 [Monoraphidium minutum]
MSRYNPITHHGSIGAPAEAPHKGLKLAPAAAAGAHLTGAACMPAHEQAPRALSPSPGATRGALAALPAKIDHLQRARRGGAGHQGGHGTDGGKGHDHQAHARQDGRQGDARGHVWVNDLLTAQRGAPGGVRAAFGLLVVGLLARARTSSLRARARPDASGTHAAAGRRRV